MCYNEIEVRNLTVQIEKLDHYGRGITRINDKICFVENALPKEIVEIKIIKETKKYFLATTTKIIKKSEDRTDIPCPYTNQCGGCNLAHLSFEKENEFKTEKVKEIMNKFAKLDSKIIKEIVYDKPYHYRNKITLHQKEKKIGLYQKETNNIIPITKCLLLNDKLNEELGNIKPKTKKDIILKIGNKTDEILSPTNKNNYIISISGTFQGGLFGASEHENLVQTHPAFHREKPGADDYNGDFGHHSHRLRTPLSEHFVDFQADRRIVGSFLIRQRKLLHLLQCGRLLP